MHETTSFDPLADFDAEIVQFLQTAGVDKEIVQLETPPQRELGERASNIALRLSRQRGKKPRDIAEEIAATFRPEQFRFLAEVDVAGPGFINFRLRYDSFGSHVLQAVRESGRLYGRKPGGSTRRMVVEHTSVNPNKEWHIGHVRNAVLGDVLGRLLSLEGQEVEIQNYIDDTGLQAAQSVVGLLDFPEQQRPEEKFDHYAGRLYVKIAAELAAEPELKQRMNDASLTADEQESVEARLSNIRSLQERVLRAMHGLEDGEYYPIIQRILDAQLQTAFRLGIFYDLLNWESHLVQSHTLREAVARLEQSPYVSRPAGGRYQGALVIETGPPKAAGEEPKCEVLIRSNGLPTYVGKDIAYHMWKFALLPDHLRYIRYMQEPNGETLWSTELHRGTAREGAPDRVVNVIGVNQSQAQDAVRAGLRAAGFPQAADNLVHLAYGLVSTKEGKLSGRKGTSVSGDAVIDQAVQVALERVQEKRSQDLSDAEMQRIAEAVGIGAIRYFMVQYNPSRDIVFDVKDVVSYDGNTGLYIQYALVRMFAILRRTTEAGMEPDDSSVADPSLLTHVQEQRLLFHLAQYPTVITDAARTLAVNLVAEYAFDLATIFSQFYRDCKVLNAETAELRKARLLLVEAVRDVLVNACDVLGVPVIERL